LVKLVLNELYDEGSEEYDNKLDAEIKTRIEYLKVSYKALNLEDGKIISYRDPATRCAYVYKYVAAHSDYLVQILEALRTKIHGNIFKGNTLRLSCVGGGPGSDVIGTLKYLAEYAEEEPVKKMICYLLDGEQAWSDTWTEIGESFASNIAVNVNFQKLDVRDPESWSAQKKSLKADLFTFIYFISEVYSLDDGTIAAFWKKIFDVSGSGAIFVYIDNGHESFDNYFDEQWKDRSDLNCVLRGDTTQKTMRRSEKSAEIDEYRQKFIQHPKLQATISFRVLRKR
jgi:hypothetical protein